MKKQQIKTIDGFKYVLDRGSKVIGVITSDKKNICIITKPKW